MLDLFRKKGLSSVIYGAIIVGMVAVFVIQFRPNAGQKSASLKEACVARVRGWCIDPKDYRSSYRLLMPRDQEGTPSPARARSIGLSRIALDGLIERELFYDEAERIGLKTSEDEITDQIFSGWIRMSVPASDPQTAAKLQSIGRVYAGFKDSKTKQFDVKVYERTIRNLVGRSPVEFREEQGREILAAKMRDLVTAPVRVSDTEALELYVSEKSSATVASVPLKQSWVSRWAVTSTPADVDAWAKDSKNAEQIDAIAKQREADDLPKANHLRHILIKTPPDASEDDLRAAAQKLAQAQARIKAGATFAEVARDVSDDKGSALRGGDLGEKTDGFVAPFRDAANALKAGETTAQAVQSPFGLHLIMKEDPANEAAVKAAIPKDVARELYRKAMAAEKTKNLATKLLADVKGGVKPEDAIAALIASLPKQPALPDPMSIKREPKPIVDGGAPDATVSTPEPKKPASPPKPQGAADDPDRPQLVTSSPFNKGGDPIAGLSPESQHTVIELAFSGKDGDWCKEPLAADDGLLIVTLKEHKTATPDEFAKEKDTFVRTLLAAKQVEALSMHVKRLREQAKDEIKVDETYLMDRTADGGAAPASDEEEEAP